MKAALFLLGVCLLLAPLQAQGNVYYVATDGDDNNGNGSSGTPWATITWALDHIPDSSTVLVRPGTYHGRIRIRGTFARGAFVRSEVPYRARLRHNATVITCYQHTNGCQGITLEGFDIAHDGPGAGALVVQVEGGGNNSVHHITIRNNVIHDSYNNDLLKINNSTSDILVEGNMFYNQTGSERAGHCSPGQRLPQQLRGQRADQRQFDLQLYRHQGQQRGRGPVSGQQEHYRAP